jgi:hypothetical protein
MGAAKGKSDAAVDIIELRCGFEYAHNPAKIKPSHEEQMEAFRNELRKLLR